MVVMRERAWLPLQMTRQPQTGLLDQLARSMTSGLPLTTRMWGDWLEWEP